MITVCYDRRYKIVIDVGATSPYQDEYWVYITDLQVNEFYEEVVHRECDLPLNVGSEVRHASDILAEHIADPYYLEKTLHQLRYMLTAHLYGWE